MECRHLAGPRCRGSEEPDGYEEPGGRRDAQCHLILEFSRVAAAENSPAFQRWVLRSKELKSRRDGGNACISWLSVVPPGLAGLAPVPSTEVLGYRHPAPTGPVLRKLSGIGRDAGAP